MAVLASRQLGRRVLWVVDQDDIDVYVAVSKRPWNAFRGYTLGPDGYHATHTAPF